MLLRGDLYRVVSDADIEEIERIYRLATEVRLKLPPYLEAGWLLHRKVYFPECHEVAHAFAAVTGIEAVDGVCVVLTKTEQTDDGSDFGADFAAILHSWNEFSVPGAQRFILDVLPEHGSSVLPVLLQAPHPAYLIPKDPKACEALLQIQRPRLQRKIKNLIVAMRECI